MISTLLGAKLGAALAAGAVSFGAVGAAAYTGLLPPGLQNLAHTTIGAPAAEQSKTADSTKKTAVGPDATGHAAFGLCTAWTHVQANGKAADKSVAFRNLATAAGGATKIAAYCAKVPHPGATATGKPSVHPTGKRTPHPNGKPSHLPSHTPRGSGAIHQP